MRSTFRWWSCAGCLGLLLSATMARGQEEQRSVVVATAAARGIGAPPAMARRYWADYAGRAIRRSNLDGSAAGVLVPDVDGPYGVAFDPASRQLVWTSAGQEVVQAASLDGSGVVTLSSSFEEGFAIAAREGDRPVVYGLIDNQIVKISEDRQTGDEQREVLLELSSPEPLHGLALTPDGAALYLGDQSGQMDRKLTLATHELTPLVFDGTPALPATTAAPREVAR